MKKFALGLVVGIAGGMAAGFHLSRSSKVAWHKYKLDRIIGDVEAEIFERLVQTKRLTEDVYADIVDDVIGSYIDLKRFSEDKASRIADSSKARFREMQKLAKESAQRAKEEIDEADEA